MRLSVVEGDITTEDVDAIVNAANARMRGGGGVDGAIHHAAGPALLRECAQRFPAGLATGSAGWTHGHDLLARWVIHVVGPNWNAGERDRSVLVSCYVAALSAAEEVGADTVAFPLVSAGVYGWPRQDAIRVAVDTLRSTPTSVTEARIVAFGRSAYDAVAATLSAD